MLELGGLLDVHISILHISRPQENCRSSWRTPLLRAPPTWLSDAQRLHNEPLTPVSRKGSNFGPRAPPVRREVNDPTFPHPTTYNPPNDASHRYVRHSRPFLTPNPITTTYLPLFPNKRQISPPLRHRAAPRHAFRTTHTPQPTTHRIMKTSATVQGRPHV